MMALLTGADPKPMARALREGDSCYAATTYAFCELVFSMRGNGGRMPPLTYGSLDHLLESEPAWELIETPDKEGFCGLTSLSVTNAFYSAEFLAHIFTEYYGSDAVCFVPAADDEYGAHAAVMDQSGSVHFPPNTRFDLKEVLASGSWTKPDGLGLDQLDGRLLVVSATYRMPRAGGKRGRAAASLGR